MGCGNSRDVSLGILINTPSNNTRVLVHTTRGENRNGESRRSAALVVCTVRRKLRFCSRLPVAAPGEGALPSPPFSSAPGKAWRLTGCFFEGAKKDKCYRFPALAIPPQTAKRDGKNAGTPYLIVRVWNRWRTLRLLTCNRGKERSSLVMFHVTQHEGLSRR